MQPLLDNTDSVQLPAGSFVFFGTFLVTAAVLAIIADLYWCVCIYSYYDDYVLLYKSIYT